MELIETVIAFSLAGTIAALVFVTALVEGLTLVVGAILFVGEFIKVLKHG